MTWHKTIAALTQNTCNFFFFIIIEKLELLSELVNVTNQTFIIKHRPVAPGWRVSRSSVAMCIYMYQSRPLCNPTDGFLLSFMSSYELWCIGTLAVEQFAVCLAKQARKSQQLKSRIVMQHQYEALKCQGVVTYMSRVEALATRIKSESSDQNPFGVLIKASRWPPNC